jgi:hypothetical protein
MAGDRMALPDRAESEGRARNRSERRRERRPERRWRPRARNPGRCGRTDVGGRGRGPEGCSRGCAGADAPRARQPGPGARQCAMHGDLPDDTDGPRGHRPARARRPRAQAPHRRGVSGRCLGPLAVMPARPAARVRPGGTSGRGSGPRRHHADPLAASDERAVAGRQIALETLARVIDISTVRLPPRPSDPGLPGAGAPTGSGGTPSDRAACDSDRAPREQRPEASPMAVPPAPDCGSDIER